MSEGRLGVAQEDMRHRSCSCGKDARLEHGREDAAVADARVEAGCGHRGQGRHTEAEKCCLEAH